MYPQLGESAGIVMISVVGAGLTLPVDVEPYGPQESRYSAAQR
jgi:hypothetical protein